LTLQRTAPSLFVERTAGMRYIKRILCFFYFVQAAGCALALALVFSPSFREGYAQGSRYTHAHPFPSNPLALLSVSLILGFIALIFGGAWLTVATGKRSARYWVILPSLLYLAAAVASLFGSPIHPVSMLLSAFLGVAGLALTWNSSWSKAPVSKAAAIPKNTGDGTSDLLNKGAQIAALIGYIAAAIGCSYWMRALGQPRYYGGLLLSLFLLFMVTLVHELGHASIGLALHMRLRAFLAGPFEFRMREGKWTFRFNFAGIVGAGGATGVVPSIPNPPRWHSLLMIAAGPAINLYTGLIALAFAYACSVSGGDNLDYVYPLARFAAFNFVACIFNMIPMRTGSGYSDGAQIFQLLSGGAWADYHRVTALVGSSLVTSVRPRDYDIEAIKRASQTISKGQTGLLLRLYAHSYCVDSGLFDEAREALERAEEVYKDSASGIPAGLHMTFIFSSAVVRRDAAATRLWWDRMIAKKPTRQNFDFWQAQCAQHWMQGDLSKAEEAWKIADAMSRQLPSAGAYEYDRTCCTLLRQAMDGATLNTNAPKPKEAPVATLAAPVVTQAPAAQWHFLNPGAALGPTPTPGSE
jgi:hypothetical protein